MGPATVVAQPCRGSAQPKGSYEIPVLRDRKLLLLSVRKPKLWILQEEFRRDNALGVLPTVGCPPALVTLSSGAVRGTLL